MIMDGKEYLAKLNDGVKYVRRKVGEEAAKKFFEGEMARYTAFEGRKEMDWWEIADESTMRSLTSLRSVIFADSYKSSLEDKV